MILKIYKSSLSTLLFILLGKGCRFQPTCSEYASEAIEEHGIVKGTTFAAKRLAKCHPWGDHGYDPVPKN